MKQYIHTSLQSTNPREFVQIDKTILHFKWGAIKYIIFYYVACIELSISDETHFTLIDFERCGFHTAI